MGMFTPDEAVKNQQSAFKKAALSFGPNQQEQQKAQQSQQMDKVSDASFAAAKQGGYQGQQIASGVGGQIANEVATLASQQNAAQDKGATAMAGMEENMYGARQKQGATNFRRDVGLQQQALAELVAQQAFDMGIESKELIFHQNKAVQDVAWTTLKKDFAEGRVTQEELADLAFKFKDLATNKQDTSQYNINQTMKSFLINMQKGNVETAKARILEAYRIQMDAAQEAARAANTAGILSGGFGMLGLGTGALFGGVPGASTGYNIGSNLGGLANAWFK